MAKQRGTRTVYVWADVPADKEPDFIACTTRRTWPSAWRCPGFLSGGRASEAVKGGPTHLARCTSWRTAAVMESPAYKKVQRTRRRGRSALGAGCRHHVHPPNLFDDPPRGAVHRRGVQRSGPALQIGRWTCRPPSMPSGTMVQHVYVPNKREGAGVIRGSRYRAQVGTRRT